MSNFESTEGMALQPHSDSHMKTVAQEAYAPNNQLVTSDASAAATKQLVTTGALPDLSIHGMWESAKSGVSSAVSETSELAHEAGDLASQGVQYAEAHPIKALGYAAGGIVGGAVGAMVAPEVGVAAGVGALAGIAAVELGITGSADYLNRGS